MPSPPKVQRWIDLLAALLARRYPVPFSELIQDVPAYAMSAANRASLMRMFERDKDELRSLGIPIDTVPDEDGELSTYRVANVDFYLPYLYIAAPPERATTPRRVNRYGYRELKELAFTPDELSVVVDAAARVRSLGEPLLADDAASAVRKLAIDLPVDVSGGDVEIIVQERPDPLTFEDLSDALTRRKSVSFAYHSMSQGKTERRTVEPYGLFFLGAHWYLAARDPSRDDIRNFRLTRMSSVQVNTARRQTPDYEIPSTFRLREHARSRQAWELGEGEALAAVVRFRTMSGPATAASRLGEPVPDDPELRSFSVRRTDAFVRWLMSFAGDVVPVSPPDLVDAYRKQVAETRALYAESART